MEIKEFVQAAKADIERDNQQGNYCIILYTVHGSTINERLVARCIYKSIDDFEQRVEGEIKGIDPMFGIRFQLWYFD
jgi:hypothetical protein